ncbi:helix-turn-helix domain-containing protein [Streptomyces sp. NPDC085929]|uniref:helix-turn-helix domain-containing protein n=1 Tax=Streptomyces sp. NPDC085929 TaxID=3365739 RepID=UPI0037D7EA62
MIPAVCRRGEVSGGGLTAERRAFRKSIRLQAGQRFVAGEKTAVIAKDSRVSVRSVERWCRAWREGGMEALRSAGPANAPTVNRRPFRRVGGGTRQGTRSSRFR